MDDKAQVSMEVVIVLGVAILVLLSLFNVWWERMSLAREVGEAGEAKMVGELLAETINTVYANGVNFSITLTEEEINYTRLRDAGSIEGGGMALPIVINTAQRRINITKDMSKTGGANWTAQVTIIPPDIEIATTTSEFPETTIRFNGSHILVYANETNIQVV